MTDGVLESESPFGEEFGSGRLLEVLGERHRQPAREIVGHIYGAVREFAHDEKQADDLTIVICKRHSEPH
jgi:serine phosphatase RsbU (regulator of sigma subunit)